MRNKKLAKCLPLLAIPIISLILFSNITQTQAQESIIRIDDLTLKFVLTFSMTGITETQITNYITNQLYPDMRDDLITKLDANFINYTISKKLKVTDFGSDRFEVYPKISFSGNTTLSKTQLRNGLDSTIDDWLTTVENSLAANNAFDVEYHLHKSFGHIDVSSCCL